MVAKTMNVMCFLSFVIQASSVVQRLRKQRQAAVFVLSQDKDGAMIKIKQKQSLR